jgi:hypothetical protein
MMTAASKDASQPPHQYDGGLALLYVLGRYGQSLLFMLLSVFIILNGLTLLGLLGPTTHVASQLSHWRAAVDLALGGGMFATGVFTLLNKLNQKAA